ncbi:RIO1 family [Phytophthora infestans]|uniref:non-specific serine/threonine protein kinase n=1 Tax=Phytophthora infestans TaxID=4787 RepID=A0A833T2B0_PHYIN|nr:RIO1 family [Phytophthora infestans]
MKDGDDFRLSKAAENQLARTLRNEESGRTRHTGRDDRATTEQVLDPRTRMILYKMLNHGIVTEINGCLSTGKEANVYHARLPDGREGAIKSNPRKMVKLWAEKEMRNLRRLRDAGIYCPAPILLRSHVLLMDFIGLDGWAAPRLKDAKISDNRYRECYLYCIKMMRTMYQKCRLVHGDLSEYNILYYQAKLYFIDVSQSVEHEHPSANDFLRKDCRNIADYFRKTGALNPMTTQELFDFVTDPRIADEDVDDHLEAIQRMIADRPVERTNEEQVDEAVFMSTFIPRSLGEVLHSEREQLAYQEGTMEKALVTAISRLEVEQGTPSAPATQGTRIMDLLNEEDDQEIVSSDDDDSDEGAPSESDFDSDYDDEDDAEVSPLGKMPLTDEQRTAYRQEKRDEQTKEEKKAKRQTKIPKHVKKRHKKLAHQKKKK